jgi:hypothetical protein
MLTTKRWRIGTFILAAALLASPTLQAAEAGGRSAGWGRPAASLASFVSPALWRSLLTYWLPLDRSAASARHGSRGGRRGSGLLPTCDEGVSLDPSGRCVKSAPVCDAGVSLDPNGRCGTSSPAGDEGVSLDPDGR